ncbi:MAG: 16S rRNA (adenine(1518)-N(6)/adenine(1519)-N(6))-dimethyltransferase RsmA [Nitrospiraceae bacterium]|nr:16S rRNA (adenine(1518)-N(6)/adenine(1519)-N(6))-dimethyltransferase RsmA [Nitrospiraceae bacterium]
MKPLKFLKVSDKVKKLKCPLKAKKHLGQNFLFDPSILQRIVEVSGIKLGDTVVEIGPGHGRLTKMLAIKADNVIAIEYDRDLYQNLKEELNRHKNIVLINGDALDYPYETLSEFMVVANIPYYITTPIIFRLIESRKNLKSMTLTIQKEVAERIVAKPGVKDYGVLSLMIQYYSEPELKFIIPRGAFRPVPKVDSAVVKMKMRESPPIKVNDEKLMFRLIKASFTQRRKIISNSLKSFSENIREILSSAGIDHMRRAGTLSIEDFARLADILSDEQLHDKKA